MANIGENAVNAELQNPILNFLEILLISLNINPIVKNVIRFLENIEQPHNTNQATPLD